MEIVLIQTRDINFKMLLKTLILMCILTSSTSQNRIASYKNTLLRKQAVSTLHNSYSINIEDCPVEYCTCTPNLRNASCQGHRENLYFIPKLPNSVQVLWFYDNYLPYVNRKTFRNISSIPIQDIRLWRNSILRIASDAFIDLKYLKTIDLSDNSGLDNITVIRSFNSLPGSIEKLYLNNLGWEFFLSAEMFQPLTSKNVTKIALRGNNFEVLNGSVFESLGALRTLDLSSNMIQYYNFTGLSRLRELKLQGNYLQHSPKFCDENAKSLIPNLEILNLGNNGIQYVSRNSFLCLKNLRSLILDKNYIRWKLKSNTFSYLSSLEKLSISNIGNNFNHIGKFAFNNSNLRHLRFADNSFHFDILKRFDPEHIFKLCPRLEKLELSKSYFPSDSRIFQEMFLPLKNLKILILQHINITILPTDFFPHFPFLKKLVLAANKISSWNGSDVFGNMTSLKSLFLNNNLISVINKTSFPEPFLSSLEVLALDRNPLSCTCDNKWFRDWIRMNTTDLKEYPNRYVCAFPPELSINKTLFRDFNPTEESCAEKNILITTIAIVSIFVLVPTASMILAYRCRWHIRYKFYLIRKKGYEKLPNDEDCVYNGFVVYSDVDRYWVHNEMLKTLEENEGLRLCIRHRDFECGKVYVDNIVENMNASRKIILVLSNNFVDDEWCNFQMLLAQQRLVKEGSGILILVMLHEIDYNNLTSSMHSLVTTTSYAAWTEEEPGKQLFWEQVITAMRIRSQFHITVV